MPWAGTWDDDVDVMAIDAVNELGKTVYIYADLSWSVITPWTLELGKTIYIYADLWWSVITPWTLDTLLWWYPGFCPALNGLAKVCPIVGGKEWKFQACLSFF